MRWFFRTDFRSFYLLNATQFLGALNDNVFKLLVIYLMIDIKGPASANAVLALAGAIFVIPFLIFSSSAGILADRSSKRTIIVITKALELLIMLFGFVSVYLEWEVGAYTALFFMAAQSALFGPSKYGIIPELVDAKKVSKANGSMTSFTYLAIILGTFLASFITDITGRNFVLVAAFCVLIAVIGLLTSLGIRRTEPQNSEKKINPFFLYEIYRTVKEGWEIPHLLPAIYGSSFFLFIGAFTQLNIIPFAMQSLHLSEVGGGYLFLATAVGIAIGAVLAGQLSKDRVELGLSCLTGFFIAIFFFMLYLFSTSLVMTIISLALLGIFGGAYLIPFDAFLQVSSPDEKRGQIIAAANFFSFIGVLMAAFCLYVISEELGLSAKAGFALMGILAFVSNIFISGRLSALFLPFFVKKVLKRFRRLQAPATLPDPTQIIVLQSNSWWDAIALFGVFPKLKILLPQPFFQRFPWFNGLVDSLRIIPEDPSIHIKPEKIFGSMKRLQHQNSSMCLFLYRKKGPQADAILESYKKVFARFRCPIVYAHGTKERIPKQFLFFRYFKKHITLNFTNNR